jgi:hypothetical protein
MGGHSKQLPSVFVFGMTLEAVQARCCAFPGCESAKDLRQ